MFTSDLHIGHDRTFIWEKRGFRNVGHHDEAVVASLRELRCARLYLLGDVMMGNNKLERLCELVASLPYPVTLVAGNHDPSIRALGSVLDVHASLDTCIDGRQVTMSHFPANFVDHHGRDFTEQMPPDDGRIVLHGHTHSTSRSSVVGERYPAAARGLGLVGRPGRCVQAVCLTGTAVPTGRRLVKSAKKRISFRLEDGNSSNGCSSLRNWWPKNALTGIIRAVYPRKPNIHAQPRNPRHADATDHS